MRRRWHWLIAGCLAAAMALAPAARANGPMAGDPGGPEPSTAPAGPVKGQAIIEFAGAPAAALMGEAQGESAVGISRAQRAIHLAELRPKVRAAQDRVLAAMDQAKIPYQLLHRYDTVFNGVAVQIDPAQWEQVKAVPGVAAIHPDMPRTLMLDYSAPYIGSMAMHAYGYDGYGVVVGVIDTGIDWTHRDLGGNGPDDSTTFPTSRVIGGWDFVGDAYTGCGDPLDPDPLPMDDHYHGTHVAGIVGASGVDGGGLTGVAPAVRFRAYKVFGAGGNTCESTVVAAIEQAVLDGVDVINLSLGSAGGTENDPDSRAVNHAAMAGVVAAVSAGNSGPGPYTSGSPASARHAVTVGAFTDDGVSIQFAEADGVPDRIRVAWMWQSGELPEAGLDLPYVFVGFGAPEDYAGKEVAGQIALVQRGLYFFGYKAQVAQEQGAAAAVIFNSQPAMFEGIIDPSMFSISIPVFSTSGQSGQQLLAALQADPDARMFLDPTLYPFPDQAATFTSEGPTLNYHWLKPDVVAPGVDVAAPVPYGAAPEGYGELSGTSMSAPHVAGAAAILRQIHPEWSPWDIKAALMNTARITRDYYTGQRQPLMQQGAGMVDILAAASSPIRAYSLTFGRPDAASFSFGLQPSGTRRTLLQQARVLGTPGDRLRYRVEWVTDRGGMNLLVLGDTRVPPSGQAHAVVMLRLGGRRLSPGVYGGYLWVTSGLGGEIHLPFAVVIGERA